jgi:hypothetical protein
MSLQHIPLGQIQEGHLQALLDAKIKESRVIEYKRELHLSEAAQKRELVYDVSSFANAAGGDIIYGMSAEDGIPSAMVGLKGVNLDSEQLRIEEFLRAGVSPRITGVGFREVSLGSGGLVLVIRVPGSWSKPHMAVVEGVTRFYSRHSNGRYQLDVHELRTAFLESENVSNRIRDFRLDRISRFLADEVGVRFNAGTSGKYAILHISPVNALKAFDYYAVGRESTFHFRPMRDLQGFIHVMNLEGSIIKSQTHHGSIAGYVQVFRDGAVEAVTPLALFSGGTHILPGNESVIRDGLTRYIDGMRGLGLEPPFVIGLTLLNVGGLTMAHSDDPIGGPTFIDRPHLVLPEVIYEDPNIHPDKLLRPLLDLVWNACGHLHSPNFDESGWKSR